MPDPSPTIPTPPPIPDRVVLGANGAYWRDFSDGFYSMCPNSTDNDPVEPVAVYVLAARLEAAERDLAATTIRYGSFLDWCIGYTDVAVSVSDPWIKRLSERLRDERAELAAAQQPPADGVTE